MTTFAIEYYEEMSFTYGIKMGLYKEEIHCLFLSSQQVLFAPA